MKKIYITILLCLYLFTDISAQIKLSGTVTDDNNKPLIGAAVYLPELSKGTVTNEKGAYTLINLPEGKHKIRFSFIGYGTRIETVLLSNDSSQFNISLEETTIEAEEIVVSGGYNSTQHENAVKIDVLQLENSGNAPSPSFMKQLTKIPGVNLISKGNGIGKPVIRGLSMDNVLVLNNGVRNENYQYSDHHPLGISEYGIEKVEVIKGPASLLYGSDAIGGVINFIREKPAQSGTTEGDYNLQLFSNSLGFSNNLGIKSSSKSFFGGFRIGQKSNADYYQGGEVLVPNTRFNELSVKANGGYTGKAGIFKLSYDYNQEKIGLPEEEAVETIQNRGRKNEIWYQQFNTHLLSSQNKMFLDNFRLELNAALQSTELLHFAGKDTLEIAMKLNTATYESKLYLPSGTTSEYIVGFQGMYQTNTNTRDADEILLPDATTVNSGLFALVQHTFYNKLRVQTGLRYDYKTILSEETGIAGEEGYRAALDKYYGSLSGSVGATFNISPELLIRANLAKAFRTPNLAELTSNGLHELRFEAGNSELKPQDTWEYDVSTHLHFDNFTFDIAGFYNTIDNYIFIAPSADTTPEGYSVYRYSQSHAKLFGGEAGLHIHPQFTEWLHIQATFSNVTGKNENGTYLPFIPANSLNFELKAEKKDVFFFSEAFVLLENENAFAQNHPAPEEESTQAYSIFNLATGGEIAVKYQKLSVVFSINNLLDTIYIDHLSTLKEAGYYNPGRDFSVSIKVPFGF